MKKLSGGIAAIGLLIGFAGPASAAYIDYDWNDLTQWEQLTLSEGKAADIDVAPYLLGWDLGGGGSLDFNYTSNAFNLFESNAFNLFDLLDLRDFGALVAKDGDFDFWKLLRYFDRKRDRDRKSVAVPEPGSLALLSIGLIGMGVALSRRRSPK